MNPELVPAMTFEQIAAELGVSKQRVQQIFKDAMRKMRNSGLDTAGALVADLERVRSYARPTGARNPERS
jgi:predicted DNA-binding protein (UPF0251 family)